MRKLLFATMATYRLIPLFSLCLGLIAFPGGAIASPKDLVDPPTQITFTILNSCGSGDTYNFFLNGTSIGSVGGNQGGSCTCSPTPQTFTVNNAALLAGAWNSSGSNSLRFTKTGTATYFAWVSAQLTFSTGSSRAYYDYNGGDATETNLCNAQYSNSTFDQALVTSTVFYRDADGDEFGDANNIIYDYSPSPTTTPPTGYVTNNKDCNDSDPSIPSITPCPYSFKCVAPGFTSELFATAVLPNGTVVAGSGQYFGGGFGFDNQGNVYATSTQNYHLYRMNISSTVAQPGAAGSAPFNGTMHSLIDLGVPTYQGNPVNSFIGNFTAYPDGSVYAQSWSLGIVKIDLPTATIIEIAAPGAPVGGWGIYVDPQLNTAGHHNIFYQGPNIGVIDPVDHRYLGNLQMGTDGLAIDATGNYLFTTGGMNVWKRVASNPATPDLPAFTFVRNNGGTPDGMSFATIGTKQVVVSADASRTTVTEWTFPNNDFSQPATAVIMASGNGGNTAPGCNGLGAYGDQINVGPDGYLYVSQWNIMGTGIGTVFADGSTSPNASIVRFGPAGRFLPPTHSDNISLTPATDTKPVGSSDVLTATLVTTDLSTNQSTPVANTSVTFTVVGGPDVGQAFTGTTDADGNVTFTLVNQNGAGDDVVHAQFVDGNNNTQTSNNAVITFVKPTCTAPAFTSCPGNQTANTLSTSCDNTVTYSSTESVTGSPAPTITYSFTGATTGSGTGNGSGSLFNKGTTTVTLTATNNCGTATCSFDVTVTDNQKPTVKTQDITVQLDANGQATVTPAQIDNGSTDNCSIPQNGYALSKTSFDCSNVGVNTVTLTVTDVNGNSDSKTATVTITALDATTSVTVTPGTQQYSDKVSFEATVDPGSVTGGCTAATSVTFMIGTQNMGTANLVLETDGKLHARLNDVALFENPDSYELSPGSKTVTAVINGKSTAFNITNPTTTLVITREDAKADYTGTQFVGTSCVTCNTATVTLSATIRDITAVVGSGDPDRGDIRKARVMFVNRDASDAPLSGWLTPGLVNATDIKTGTVTANWTANIGTSDAQQFTVGIIVKGEINNTIHAYYTRNSSEDNAVITVAKPLNDFITGGGYLILTNPSGLKAGDLNSKNNFGFNVKYNKSGTNLQGNINTIIRRTEVDGDKKMHVYQIKGNAMTSMSATSGTTTSPGIGSFNGKASIQDITYTDPSSPEYKAMYKPSTICPDCYGSYSPSVDGGALLQVTMTDRGEPGTTDGIAITVQNKDGGLWYASNWNGVKTNEQIIAAGNLRVNTGTTNTGAIANSVTLTSNNNPSTVGQNVTFKATIVESNSATPTGYVTFTDGTTVLANVPVSTTSGITSASFSTSLLSVGDHTIKAYYSGDSKFAPTNASIKQTVNNIATTRRIDPATESINASVSGLTLKAMPNPTALSFKVQVNSNNQTDKIVLQVVDVLGRLVQVINTTAGQTITLGDRYRPGAYILEATQGKQRETLKLVKLSN